MIKGITSLIFAFVFTCSAFAVLYSADKNAFTVDLPSSWVKVNSKEDVLSLKRDDATLKIKLVKDCSNMGCLDAAIKRDLASVRAKKFKVLENTYTGDTIKRTEFSTGDPLLSFNFSGAAVDFTTGYFLADGKAYSVAVKGLPYVESDLILSFISPAAKPTDPEAGAAPVHNLNEPEIADIAFDDHPKAADIIIMPDEQPQESDENFVQESPKEEVKAPKPVNWINIAGIAALFYLLVLMLSFVCRMFLSSKINTASANPRSSYPVKGSRLYGSPDLFFKLHDNQGDNFVATSGRWGNVLMGAGIIIAFVFTMDRLVLSTLSEHGVINLHAVILNTVFSVSYLFSVFGLIIFATGFLLNILFAYKFYLYDRGGAIAYKCIQKGFHLLKEEYLVADAAGAVVFKLKRNKFTLLRAWTVYDNQGIIATVKESSALRAFARLILGHLCGFLRSNYIIKGRVDSSGTITSYSKLFTYFRTDLDKPEAVDADFMLVASVVIFMRDRDKWHPWTN